MKFYETDYLKLSELGTRLEGRSLPLIDWLLPPPISASERSMKYPDCGSSRTTRLQRTTNLGYAMFRCKDCCRTFSERTGTPFNFIGYPLTLSFRFLLCRLRYKLSFRDIAEFFLL